MDVYVAHQGRFAARGENCDAVRTLRSLHQPRHPEARSADTETPLSTSPKSYLNLVVYQENHCFFLVSSVLYFLNKVL